jgi:predicted CopG family antitoxin
LQEVNAIVSDSYSQLKKVAEEKGFSLDAASRSWEILQSSLSKITDLAGDAADQILDNHPKLKEQVGGSFTQLKQMGEQYGPEAKKQVDDVYKQVTEIVKGGVSFDTVSKIKQLVESKQKDLAKFGDAAWIKELVEKNADALKSGDMAQLWEKIKGGDAGDIESFVKNAADQAKSKANQATGGGLDKYLSMLPGLGAIGPHLSKLKEVSIGVSAFFDATGLFADFI